MFDASPTGILEGKYEEEVDFNYSNDLNQLIAVANKETIDELMQIYLSDSIQDNDWFVTEEDAL
jgi:hypothetical protein